MNEANNIIESLIEISNTKYGLLKVGKDTLNTDILFIEKYEHLKEILGANTLEHINKEDYPRLADLKRIIEKIHLYENQPRNVRMTKAVSAYKK